MLYNRQLACQAGLFSAVASAFIIQVDSQLKPDPGDETAALLRVLIYKIDNTTFGNDVPTLPQWTGPPPAMVDVQSILLASLSASLLSAFLAMLGKQWLNRYASTDMRGSAIERGQSRQQKLDGIVAWYFDSVMESLPVMLQVALLLLGCALSRYLWEISITIASVVLGVTSLGFLCYLFILVVGTAWKSCPYQTPGSHFLRYLGPRVHWAARSVVNESNFIKVSKDLWNDAHWSSWRYLVVMVVAPPIMFVADVYNLGRTAVGMLFVFPIRTYRLLRRVYTWLHSSPPSFDRQMIALDLRCISWTLQTSLDRLARLSALKHLVTITEFTDLDPNLAVDCFNLFVGFISISNGKVVVVQGLEELAALSARCFFQTFRHLLTMHQTPSVLGDLQWRYFRVFPDDTYFRGLPFYHTMTALHTLLTGGWIPRHVRWTDYRPSDQELIPFARHMVEVSQAEYQRMQARKVPRWILRFALHILSLHPSSPPSAIADCLTIIAVALDLDPSSVSILDERYIRSKLWMPTLLTKV